MDRDSLFFALSGIFATFLYILLLLLMALIFKVSSNYINISINAPSVIQSLNVDLINLPEEKNDEPTKEPTKEPISQSAQKPSKKSGSSSSITGSGIGDLFKKVPTKNKDSLKESGDNRDTIALNKKGGKIDEILKKTNKIMSELSNLNQNIIAGNESSSQFCQKYGDYCQELYEILYQNWNAKSWFDKDLSSSVLIKISKNGNFSYTIEKKSGNEMFDSELLQSLENLKGTKFPIIDGVDVNNLAVIFKNQRGD